MFCQHFTCEVQVYTFIMLLHPQLQELLHGVWRGMQQGHSSHGVFGCMCAASFWVHSLTQGIIA